MRLVEVTEDTTDPAVGRQLAEAVRLVPLTAQTTRTRFGGHGGSEALPEEKIARDPWLKRMFLGYAFSIDYRDRRGHAYMLADQEATQRLTKPQTGSCLHCHASVMPLYRELGNGDAAKGLEASYKFSYQELNKKLHDSGHAHPVSCVDCHDPKTMQLRVTRPGFIQGIQMLAASDAPVPASAVDRALAGRRQGEALRPERGRDARPRCARSSAASATSSTTARRRCRSRSRGARACARATMEKFWNETKFADGKRFFDYKHAETGAPILKAQHPEFELWSQGVHARSGVACADCHMPYVRDGATKVSDHWVRSPLLNINRACQTCHRVPEEEIKARVDAIQQRNFELMQRGGAAIVALIDAIVAAKKEGATPEQLQAGARAAAQGAVAARLHRRRELDGLPRPAGGGDGARRSDRLRAPGRARGDALEVASEGRSSGTRRRTRPGEKQADQEALTATPRADEQVARGAQKPELVCERCTAGSRRCSSASYRPPATAPIRPPASSAGIALVTAFAYLVIAPLLAAGRSP